MRCETVSTSSLCATQAAPFTRKRTSRMRITASTVAMAKGSQNARRSTRRNVALSISRRGITFTEGKLRTPLANQHKEGRRQHQHTPHNVIKPLSRNAPTRHTRRGDTRSLIDYVLRAMNSVVVDKSPYHKLRGFSPHFGNP